MVPFNPERDIPRDISEGWARRVALAKRYGNILQTDEEVELVRKQGLLRIEWPRLVRDDSPLPLDIPFRNGKSANALGSAASLPDS